MKKKTIGIIGGMGPLATADLFTKIIKSTKAPSDAAHIHIIVDNDPSIPDRTECLLRGGESPVPHIIRSARLLQNAGADLLVMPCNAAHCFLGELAKEIEIPVLDMVGLTAEYLLSSGVKRAALFAVDGTVRSGVYSRACGERGIELMLPGEALQKEVMNVIYKGVKAGEQHYGITALQNGIDEFTSQGAQVIILGCTELPPAVELYGLKGSFADPTLILARAAVELAGYEPV